MPSRDLATARSAEPGRSIRGDVFEQSAGADYIGRSATSWGRRLAMRLAAGAVGLTLAASLLEVTLRCAWQRDLRPKTINTLDAHRYYRRDPELGLRPKPNLRGVHRFFHAAFTTNSRGLRGSREYAPVRQPGVARIVAIGDSFTWGFGVEDEETFARRLERDLVDTEVINLGVSSYQVPDAFRYLRDEGMRYRPDVVLLALCQNDFCVPPTRRGATRDHPLAASVLPLRAEAPRFLRGLKALLNRHSYLYAACIEGINAHKALARAAVALGLKEGLAGFEGLDLNLHAALLDAPASARRAVERTSADILALHAFLSERGVAFVVALIPSLQSVNRRAFVRTLAYTQFDTTDFDLERPYRLVERLGSRHGFMVCNPLEAFRSRCLDGARLYLPKDMHFSADGHRAFAEFLAPVLQSVLDDAKASLFARRE